MRLLLILAATCCYGQSLRSLSVGGTGATATVTGATIASYRVEGRVTAVASKNILNDDSLSGNFNCNFDASIILTCRQGADGAPGGLPSATFTNGQDVRYRWQRDASGLTYTLETWTGACANYAISVKTITSGGNFIRASGWVFGPTVTLGFLRIFNTLDTSHSCPVDAPVTAGQVFDWIFEADSLVDRSSNGYTMTAATGTFSDSTLYPPTAAITGLTAYKMVIRAMAGQSFSGATSTSLSYPGTGEVASYFWQQISGPAQSVFSSRTSVTSTITPTLGGQYVYRLTVSDATGTTASVDQTVGVVATDSNGVVINSTDEQSKTIGNVIRNGASSWPWHSATSAAVSDWLYTVSTTPPVCTPGTGTVEIPSTGINQVVGGQITANTYGGVAIQLSGGTFSGGDVGTRICINWDADGDASFRGRFVGYVNSLQSGNTIAVLPSFFITNPTNAFPAGLTWGRMNSTYNPYNTSAADSKILPFYEAGLAIGRLAASTGLTVYRTQFHSFCDNVYRWSTDSGYAFGLGRNSPAHALIACGSDPTYSAPTGYWAGMERVVTNMANLDGGLSPSSPVTSFDPRETSYALRGTALLASVGVAHGLNGTTWCTRLANQVTNIWVNGIATPAGYSSTDYGMYPESLFTNNITIPSVPINGVYGTSPWRSNGLPAIALIAAYDALANASGCNNTALAAQLYTAGGLGTGVIPRLARFIYDFGRGADGGVLAAVLYANDTNGEDPTYFDYNSDQAGACAAIGAPGCHFAGQTLSVANGATAVTGVNTIFTKQFWNGGSALIGGVTVTTTTVTDNTHMTLSTGYSGSTLTNSASFSNPSTIAVTSGSTAVVGTNTHFTTQFPSTYPHICIWDITSDNRGCYRTTVTNDTNLTLDRNYTGTTRSGIGTFGINRDAPSTCPLSLSTTCNEDFFGGRNLSADAAGSAGWLCRMTGNSTWCDITKYYLNKQLGGGSTGAGSPATPPTGTSVYAPGVITVTASSTAVSGVGTAFLSQFGNGSTCPGTTYLTVADGVTSATFDSYSRSGNPSLNPTWKRVLVASCASNTSLTLSAPYAGTGSTSTGMFYNATDPGWQGADGGHGNLAQVLPSCGTVPCGGGNFNGDYGKQLGMSDGAGNASVAMADILGGVVAPVTQALLIDGAFPTGGDKMRCTVTLPNGAATITTSSSGVSQCSVSPDVRMAGAWIQIAYLNSSNAVIANGDPYRYVF